MIEYIQTSRDQYNRALYLLGFAFSNNADYVYNLMTTWIDAMSMKSGGSIQ